MENSLIFAIAEIFAPQYTFEVGSIGKASTCNTERSQMKYCSEGREVALIAVLRKNARRL
jgi:hypothetical protein